MSKKELKISEEQLEVLKAQQASKANIVTDIGVVEAQKHELLHALANVMDKQKELAKELDLSTLESLSRVLFGPQADKRSTAELRRDMLVYSRNNPADFIDMLNDPSLQLYDDVSKFFGKGLLVLKNKNRDVYFNLPNNKTKILTVPFGEEAHDIISSYFIKLPSY